MSQTVDIGVARVHLVVDAADYDAAIARATNAAHGFGTDAEQAFDKSSGSVRRASRVLLDYVTHLGKTSEQMRLLRAAQSGVDHSVIEAAAAAMIDYRNQTEAAAAVTRELGRAQEEANRINAAFDSQRQTNNQRDINSLLGVSDNDGVEAARRRADAEAALLPILQAEENEYAQILDLANRINAARDDHRTQIAQRDINALLGVKDDDAEQRIRRQADARSALTGIIQAQAAAEEDAYGHNANVDAFIRQLEHLQQTAGKTHYEILELKAAQLGISTQANPLIRGLRQTNEAMGAGTLSAKQYAWAMRGLPAQLTDIGVSLASGQPAWLVLLQQGGQLKDMFGGLGPAIRAVGGAITAQLMNPLILLPAIFGAVALAAYKAEERMSQFAIAGIKSGGLAGTGAALEELSQQLNDLDNINLANADQAVQKLASGGLILGDNFDVAAEAAARWATVTGSKVDDVVNKFESIARDPLNALTKLNEAEHFLTEAQYERVRALEEEGKQQEAARLAVEIYAETVNSRAGEVAESLGNIQKLWVAIKGGAMDAASGIGSAADDIVGALMKIQKAQLNILAIGSQAMSDDNLTMASRWELLKKVYGDSWTSVTGPDFSNVQGSASGADAMTKAQTEALKELDKALSTTGGKTVQYEKAVKDLNENLAKVSTAMLAQRDIVRDASGNFSGKGYDALIKQLQDKYKESATKLPSGRDATQMIRDQLAAELAALQTQTRAVEIQYQQRLVGVEDYYDKLMSLATKERDLTIAANNAQIAALAGKKDEERQVSTLRAANLRAEESYAQRKMELDASEDQAIRQRDASYRDYIRTLDAANEALSRQMDTQVARIGMGQREFQMEEQINEVYRRQVDQLREIQNAQQDRVISTEQAEQRTQQVYAKTAEAIDIITQGYVNMKTAEADWSNGASRAWSDWIDEAENTAGQVGDIMSNALDGFTNAVAEALAGNVKSFSDFWDTIHIQILQFISKQKLTEWAQSIFGGGKGENGDVFGDLIGLLGLFDGEYFAKGGAPGGGTAAYRNSIVSSPTVFPFAKGGVPNIGLMGEAGHEAIMPLTRTSSGDLGVRVTSDGQRGPVNLNQAFYVQGTQDRTTQTQMARKAGQESSRAMARG